MSNNRDQLAEMFYEACKEIIEVCVFNLANSIVWDLTLRHIVTDITRAGLHIKGLYISGGYHHTFISHYLSEIEYQSKRAISANLL